MPNNVLFPSKDPTTDFAAPNNNNAHWVEINNNQSLKTMAGKMPANANNNADDGNAANAPRRSDPKSIPSPIAHIRAFKNDLENGVLEAVNEWRGMLAAIALQKLLGLNISVRKIELKNAAGGAVNYLGEIMLEFLTQDSNITGYTAQLDSLYVFCKDGEPFAMYMPSMWICPFKEYDRNKFSDIPWCAGGQWSSVNACPDMRTGNGLSAVGVKLYSWLNKLDNYTPVGDFQNALSKQAPQNLVNPISANYDNNGIPGQNNPLNNIAPEPDGAPRQVFSDKLFFVLPPSNGQNQLSIGQSDIDLAGANYFCPKKLNLNNGDVFVVPPITEAVVKILRSEKATEKATEKAYLCGSDWKITASDKNRKFTVEFKLIYGQNETVTYRHEYSAEADVMWTADMPYVSMWPYVDSDRWKDYMISVFVKREGTGHEEFQYDDRAGEIFSGGNGAPREPFLQGENGLDNMLMGEPVNSVNRRCLNIGVVTQNGGSEIHCCESGLKIGADVNNNQKFKIIKSDSTPWALSLSYDSAQNNLVSLGCWMIVPPQKLNNNNNNQNPVKISMDFGTSSTNVCILDGNNSRSISSPSKYVHPIYTPWVNNAGNIDPSELYQRYYLFGAHPRNNAANNMLLGKIATYGQNFSTSTQVSAGDSPNISGRFVEVDKEYIQSLDPRTGGNDGIYNGLKWATNNDQQRQDARANFISTVLNCAVLEAITLGATSIELGLSYPCESNRVAVGNLQTVINNVINKLSENGNQIKITPYYETESRCAGEYFKAIYAPAANKFTGQNANAQVQPNNGYTVVDIGGGTTDISFWRNCNGAGLELNTASQYSFNFAGRNIIEESIIDFFGNTSTAPTTGKAMDFMGFWGNTAGINDILNYFVSTPKMPQDLESYYLKKSFAINYLFANASVANVYGKNGMRDLFLAIRIKYYALFYLVASRLKKADVYAGGVPNSMALCLAGCGSKGIEICHNSNAQFEDNVCELVKKFSEYDIGTINLVMPQTQNKEEVAFGLLQLGPDGNNNGQGMNNNGAQANVGADGVNLDEEDIRTRLDALLGTIRTLEPGMGVPDILDNVIGAFQNSFNDYYNVVQNLPVCSEEESVVKILEMMIATNFNF